MTSLTLFQLSAWGICALLFAAGVRLLWRKGWLLPWLRGNTVLLFFAVSLAVGSLAVDLRGYSEWPEEDTVATMSFVEFKPQLFIARLSIPGHEDQSYEIHGDQWQLDARIIGWRGVAQSIGLPPLYRLGRLSGRFLTLEQERSEKRSSYDLGSSKYAIDTWRLLHRSPSLVPWLRPQYGSAVYMPMAHKAQYKISLSGNALIATPLNEPAMIASDSWR